MMTKDAFWNPIEAKAPKMFKEFRAWIDEYKKRVEWPKLFHEGTQLSRSDDVTKAPKVHDLPDALQIGIFFQFLTEREYVAYKPDIDFTSMESIKNGINDWFVTEESFA